MRVLAAMSGGVDSAVAAARAVEAGHDVVGVHLALSETPAALRGGSRGCCSREDAGDARRAADVLGVPFYVWDFAARFSEDVVDDFVSSYARGETPNPCLRCNEKIKFSALLDRALGLGFDAVCTGHYARLARDTDPPTLRRAVDHGKDQSYVLAVLTAEQLRHAMFPLGDTPKPAVRAEAAARGLRVADKPDSHDICFIPSGDTRGFLAARLGARPGAVVDEGSGEVQARHEGVHGFTVGQRHGLGLGRPAADGRPRYVLGIEPVSGTVRVGSAEELDVRTISATRVVWSAGVAPSGPVACTVQVRAHGGVAPATAQGAGADLRVELSEPLRGVAPGQAVALYRPDPDGDVVLGSATITAARWGTGALGRAEAHCPEPLGGGAKPTVRAFSARRHDRRRDEEVAMPQRGGNRTARRQAQARHAARDVAEEAARLLWIAARIGLVAYGLVYLVLAGLIAQVALGDRERADKKGALAEIAETAAGRVLLWVVVAG
ncbi:MAG: tRNA-uridine 2-sulfurtransferase, partial [Pseudonocardiales bacterium]|nr:tRNA-uridine 2-sulfurtransferase [Pseudonocardiales bacterium]